MVEKGFIVGFPRSGTTLLASLLNRHSKIAVPPETHYFRLFARHWPEINALPEDEKLERICRFPRIADLSLTGAEIRGILGATLPDDLAAIFDGVVSAYGYRVGKELVIEKTPGHVEHLETIGKLFPHAKFVYVVRDGRDCVLSNIREHWTHSWPLKQAAEWAWYDKLYEKHVLTLGRRILAIRYEDLLERPEQVLEEILDHFGRAYEARILAPIPCPKPDDPRSSMGNGMEG